MIEALSTHLQNSYPTNITQHLQTFYENNQLTCLFIRKDTGTYLSQITIWDDLSSLQELYDLTQNCYMLEKRIEAYSIENLKQETDDFLAKIMQLDHL